jgi:uncharacterized BrkB/YihY/UPF0761 family membrane protein
MEVFGRSARKALRHPGDFCLAVIRQFRANQGLLLAGAVAYCALLSLRHALIGGTTAALRWEATRHFLVW